MFYSVIIIVILLTENFMCEKPLIKRLDKQEQFPCRADHIELSPNVECRFSQWSTNETRCVKAVNAQLIHLDIFKCRASDNQLLFSKSVEMFEWSPEDGFPVNSFHENRVINGTKMSAKGSQCYTYRLDFNREVRIWYFIVNIWSIKWPSIVPHVIPIFNYRDCTLKQIVHDTSKELANYSYHFVCDIRLPVYSSVVDSQELKSLSIIVEPLSEGELGLEALYLADIHSKYDINC